MRVLPFLLAVGVLSPFAARADTGSLTASQIELLEQRGWITPAFATAARELIESRLAAEQARTDQTHLEEQLPDVQKKVTAEDARLAQLKSQLDRLNHPDGVDFTALQAAMKDATATTGDQLVLAQAFVWTYPSSAHAGEAEQDVRRLQKTIADQTQAAADAAAAQTAAQVLVLQGVKAHNLGLGQWRAFLQDKSQDEVTGYLGAPTGQDPDHWFYSGGWTTDPDTKQKAGLSLTFNGGRVQHVAPLTAGAPAAGP